MIVLDCPSIAAKDLTLTGNDSLDLNLQLLRGGEPAIGPARALVLEAIEETGSISAAGRSLGMSYRRVWLLVANLNASWVEPVVETKVGGGTGNGAKVTTFGKALLAAYRAVEEDMIAAAQGRTLNWLISSLRP